MSEGLNGSPYRAFALGINGDELSASQGLQSSSSRLINAGTLSSLNQREHRGTTTKALAVPQSDQLPTLRRLLEVIASGAPDRAALMSAAEVSSRHLSYRLQALRVLQLVDGQRPPLRLAPLAYRLLDAAPESDEERALFAQAIKESPTLCTIAPRLLAEEGPTAETLAAQIKAQSSLSRGTSLRRARALLRWRSYLLCITRVSPRIQRRRRSQQLCLFELEQQRE